MNYIKNQIIKSLSILDNCYVNFSVVVILILYCSLLFTNINAAGGVLYKSVIVRFIILLLISYLAHKDTNIAILLAIAYLISVKYMSISEKFDGMNTSLNYSNIPEGEMYETPSYEEQHEKMPDMMLSYEQPLEETVSFEQPLEETVSYEQPPSEERPDMYETPSYKQPREESPEMYETPSYEQPREEMPDIMESYDDLVRTQENNNVLQSNYRLNESYVSKSVASKFKNSNKKCVDNLFNTKNYVIADDCKPVATFQNEFNAQGMNYPSGFNLDDNKLGYELGQNNIENFDISEKLKSDNTN